MLGGKLSLPMASNNSLALGLTPCRTPGQPRRLNQRDPPPESPRRHPSPSRVRCQSPLPIATSSTLDVVEYNARGESRACVPLPVS